MKIKKTIHQFLGLFVFIGALFWIIVDANPTAYGNSTPAGWELVKYLIIFLGGLIFMAWISMKGEKDDSE